ncbi:mCG59656 [Mus musculus]|jgi:hypothetical protein|nr:mCG59656 [Mus musculus]
MSPPARVLLRWTLLFCFLRSVAVQCPALFPRSPEPSPETHKDTDRGFVKTRTRVRVSSGVMSPRSPAGMVQRAVFKAHRAGVAAGGGKDPRPGRCPSRQLYLVTPVRTGADLLFPAPTEDRRGGRWQGPTSFSSN